MWEYERGDDMENLNDGWNVTATLGQLVVMTGVIYGTLDSLNDGINNGLLVVQLAITGSTCMCTRKLIIQQQPLDADKLSHRPSIQSQDPKDLLQGLRLPQAPASQGTYMSRTRHERRDSKLMQSLLSITTGYPIQEG